MKLSGYAQLLGLLLVFCPASAESASQRPTDLTALSLEELANIEVTSVGKKEQKLSQAPAAVYVLTQQDIRRSGATSIPEALRMVPGLQVARIDANKWAISARGFNGQFANKLLVMIDGRSVYTPLFSGVYWDAQDLLLDDIDRIEVIRGPGGAAWGANAVNGVISIITKSAAETQGGLLTAGAGNQEQGFGGVRYGGRLGPSARYRMYSKYFQRDHVWRASGRAAADDWHATRGGFRLDWEASTRDSLTMQCDVFGGRSGETLSAFSLAPPFSRTFDDHIRSTGGNAMGRWTRRVNDNSELALQFYYDRTDRRSATIGEIRDTFDLDFQHRFPLPGRNEIVWGFGHRFTRDRILATEIASLHPDRRGEDIVNFFVQDEIALAGEQLRLSFGSKFERNDYTGLEIQPTARLLWMPQPRHTAWAAVSRAVRTPSRGERNASINFAALPGPGGLPVLIQILGNRDLDSEDLVAYEAGYRLQPARRLSLDLASFYSVYRRLVTAEPGAPFLAPGPRPHLVSPLNLTNGSRGDAYGLEVAANWHAHDRFRLAAGYAGLHFALRGSGQAVVDQGSGNPSHEFHVRAALDLSPTVQLDAAVYRVGALRIGVPAYTRLDTRLGWQPTRSLDLSLIGQDLQGGRHIEFVAETLIPPTAVGRSLFGKIAWRF